MKFKLFFFIKMDYYYRCYEEYASYFCTSFPNAPCPGFNEWASNMNLFPNSTANQGNESPSISQDDTSFQCFETSDTSSETSTASTKGKKTTKRDTWPRQQTASLVQAWKENFEALETFKQSSAWFKIKIVVDKNGSEKTIKQIKNKLRTLKDAYKSAKDNNSKTGAAPQFSQFFHEFDEMLGKRDIISFNNVKEVGCRSDDQSDLSPTLSGD